MRRNIMVGVGDGPGWLVRKGRVMGRVGAYFHFARGCRRQWILNRNTGSLIIAFDRRARKVLRCYRFSAPASRRARTSRLLCSNSDDLSDTRRRRVRASAISSTPASAFDLLQMPRRPALGAGRSAPLGTRRSALRSESTEDSAFRDGAGRPGPGVATNSQIPPIVLIRCNRTRCSAMFPCGPCMLSYAPNSRDW